MKLTKCDKLRLVAGRWNQFDQQLRYENRDLRTRTTVTARNMQCSSGPGHQTGIAQRMVMKCHALPIIGIGGSEC